MLRKLSIVAFAAMLAAAPLPVLAQSKKDSVVMAMTLEPPGLDPTNAAAAAIAEVTLYNIYETLTKINEDGSVSPLLAESWTASPDLKTYTFKLRKGVKFHNGEPFDSAAVKFSFERNAVPTSTNKDKSLYQAIEKVEAPDADTIVITMKYGEPNLPFLLGQASGSIVEPKSAATNVTQPVGTGPYQLGAWAKGSSITLSKWAGYRNASAIKLSKVTIRFISDPAAQAAALLSGDVDAFPRIATRVVAQFKADPRFTVLIGGSKAKTIVAINHRKKPLDDVRVRRAVLAAIDRKALIDGAVEGFGTPIGSFYTPGSLGYVDTTGVNPYDPEKAKKLLAEAGVTTPLELSLKLPPPPYARQGGEIVAAQLAKVGIVAKIENVEWAQWLSQVFAPNSPHNFDLTIVSHVEPFDLVKITEPDYYLGYNNEKFNALYKQIVSTPDEAGRAKLLGDAQRMLATDAVSAYLFQPQWPTVTSKKLKGVWKEVPQFENDFSTWYWE
ncbi:ABC transporter substrate-binding protein [Bradyrhizobium liaoningense]|uniref:ABC transporter substrate-binding protein n=1 Tax=Bradyrhizobium liaoningense TaxID=43992 RepID=UPI001BA5BC33|nr:ABC transporter substrate-binding protein [Bradyrhizobium liaoningense]MBR0841252.1 ABC transporter substrate-binding protein [Bradyrhizobium liaoningense]MBR0853068.1 ABC transporter substrate-binding protein [Bradyrhizobium liaoningense]